MRISSKRTPVAVLRAILGVKVPEMAGILRCSEATINSLETGRLPVSESMARRIFHETGVSPDWLIAGNPKTPPVSGRGEPYTVALFERARAEKIHFDKPPFWTFYQDALSLCAQLVAILSSAEEGSDYYFASYKAAKAIEELRNEFGQDSRKYGPTNINEIDLKPAVAILDEMKQVATVFGSPQPAGTLTWGERVRIAQEHTQATAKAHRPKRRREGK